MTELIYGTYYSFAIVNGTYRFYEGEQIIAEDKNKYLFIRKVEQIRFESLDKKFDRQKYSRVLATSHYLKRCYNV